MSDLADIERMAVMGLEADNEQMFIAHYLDIFKGQNITFVARHDDYKEIEAEQSFLLSKTKMGRDRRTKATKGGHEATRSRRLE